jgi:hypothetical protein
VGYIFLSALIWLFIIMLEVLHDGLDWLTAHVRPWVINTLFVVLVVLYVFGHYFTDK